MTKHVAIIGAGAAGLMAAQTLSAYQGVIVQVFEQMPSAGRKILWAGKTGLNISNTQAIDGFIKAYRPSAWLAPFVRNFDANHIVAWLETLGVETFVGSTGRIFPVVMKGAPFLRAWLKRLDEQGVQFYYRHRCVNVVGNRVWLAKKDSASADDVVSEHQFDAVILACGGASYARLGSDGAWVKWFDTQEITPFFASNVGVVRSWSPFMQTFFGQALKRVVVKVGALCVAGDVMISHYGLEGGVIYQLNHALRNNTNAVMTIDLLPDINHEKIITLLNKNKKQSLSNRLRKLGLSPAKIAVLRECTSKDDWQTPKMLANHIKALTVSMAGFRPLDEAISTGGGVKKSALTDRLQSCQNPYVFCCGEMLDWDAPTGGYLLTACFATGYAVGHHVADWLGLACKDD